MGTSVQNLGQLSVKLSSSKFECTISIYFYCEFPDFELPFTEKQRASEVTFSFCKMMPARAGFFV